MTDLYRKQPITVEAAQIPTDYDTPQTFLTGHQHIVTWAATHGINLYLTADNGYIIPTLEGEMHAEPGDWIIRGIAGEFYPCKPDIFAASYSRLEPAHLSDPPVFVTDPHGVASLQCDCDNDEFAYPECPIHVDCDDRCQALNYPVTVDEFRVALIHWQQHGYLSGCSHGR